MPYSPGGIRVNPNGQTAVVTFTLPGGGTPVAYSSQSGAGTVSLPASITTTTDFWFAERTTVTVSALVNGAQQATSSGTTSAVDLSGGGLAGLTVAPPSIATGTYAPLVADWTASTAYTVGQLVTNGGQVYRVSTAHTSTGSFDATKFTSQGGTSSASLTVKDEGSALATVADTLDFVGGGVTATGTGATKTITIPSPLPAGGPGVLTRTASNGTATWAPQASDVILFAPVPSGDTTGATDTAAIQALINQCYTAGGGTVQLQATNSTANPYYITQLKIRSFVEMTGVSRWGTVLRAPLGQATNLHMIINYDDTTWGFALRRFTLDGQNGKGPVYGGSSSPVQTNAFSGMKFDITTSANHFGDYQADSASVIEDLSIVQMPFAGVEIARAMSEMRFRGVYVLSCRWIGFQVGYSDCFFSDCTAGANGGIGWRVGGSVNHFSNCKSFWNGWVGSSVAGTYPADWYIDGHSNVFATVAAQDAYVSGFHLTATAHDNQILGYVAGGTTQCVKLDGATKNFVHLTANAQVNNTLPVTLLNHSIASTGNTIILDGTPGNTGALTTGLSLEGNRVTLLQQSVARAVTYAATITPDPYAGATIRVGTLTGNVTIANPTRGHVGCELSFTLTQDATGGRTVTWGAAYNATVAIPTTASSTTTVTFRYDGTTWQEVSRTGTASGGVSASFPVPPVTPESGSFFRNPMLTGQGTVSTAGLLSATPIILGRDTTLSELQVNVTVAGGASSTVRLGVYADTGSFYPGARLLDTGTISTATTGRLGVTGLSLTLAANTVYWLVGVLDGGGGTVPTVTAANLVTAGFAYMGHNAANAGYLFTAAQNDAPVGFSQTLTQPGALPATFSTTRTAEYGGSVSGRALLVAGRRA